MNKINEIMTQNSKEFEEKYGDALDCSGTVEVGLYDFLHQSQLRLLAGIREMIEGREMTSNELLKMRHMNAEEGFEETKRLLLSSLELPEQQ